MFINHGKVESLFLEFLTEKNKVIDHIYIGIFAIITLKWQTTQKWSEKRLCDETLWRRKPDIAVIFISC